MGRSAGPYGELSPSGLDRRNFVADLSACVSDWERALSGPMLPPNAALSSLVLRSTALEQRSSPMGLGGVGHHLQALVRGVHAGANLVALRAQLEVVREMLGQVRDSLVPEEPGPGPGTVRMREPSNSSGSGPVPIASNPPPHAAPPPADALPPPPLITRINAENRAPAGPAAPRFEQPQARVAGPAPPKLLFESQRTPAQQGFPGPGAAPPIEVAAPPSRRLFEPPPEPGAIRQPNLLVRSVLGLRLGRNKPPAQAGAPPANRSSLLGLKPGRPSNSPPAPPPLLVGHNGLPLLRPEPQSPPNRSPIEQRLRSGEHRRLSDPPPQRGRSRGKRLEGGSAPWWVGALAVGGVGVVVGLIVAVAVLLSRRGTPADVPGPSSSTASSQAGAKPSSSTPETPALPRSKMLNDDERLRSLLAQVHGRGKESPELRALLEEQAAAAAQALSPEKCLGAQCAAFDELRKAVIGGGPKRVAHRRSAPIEGLRSKWLAGLTMPEIHVEDDDRVRRRFEFYTESPVGRETFQQMLFRCGAFRDAIQSTLIRHGLPAALLAVVFAESGCSPLAKSPMGAEGLWQFIPDAARAYHLRILENVVDERHNPQKSTEAAVRFLSDLYAKLNDWDLVFAAYNMGPFGLMARLARMEGENVGFWDLVDADLLPEETANYAPTIEAIALILNNLQRLKFAGIQMRAPEVTLDLEVPPATRLSLVARAAAMSLNDLRRLNLDIKGLTTPNIPNFSVQVPRDSLWQAQETLGELLRNKDETDQCVPPTFDWGRQRFTPEMVQNCLRSLGAAAANASAAPVPAPAANP